VATNETREKILDAAESLFARQGFGATSLRTVIAEADVNLAAVHYHFGSKEALIRAVFSRRLAPLNAERLRRLDDIENDAAGAAVSIERLLDAFIRPAVVLAPGGTDEAPILTLLFGRLHTEPGNNLPQLIYDQFDDVVTRFVEAFTRALPDLPLDELYTRFHFVIGTMASSFADPQRLAYVSRGRVDRRDVESLITRMITFLAAALRAPATRPHGAEATVDLSSATGDPIGAGARE